MTTAPFLVAVGFDRAGYYCSSAVAQCGAVKPLSSALAGGNHLLGPGSISFFPPRISLGCPALFLTIFVPILGPVVLPVVNSE